MIKIFNHTIKLTFLIASLSCKSRSSVPENSSNTLATTEKSKKIRYTKDFLNPTDEEQQAESQVTDDLRNLDDYESLPLPTIKEAFMLPSGKIVNLIVEQRQALFLPIFVRSILNSKVALKFHQTYSDARFENLTEETLKELQFHFQVNREIKLSSTTNHNLLEFLPPEMQALAKRRGLAFSPIDCFSTAYSRFVDTQLAHLIVREESDFNFSEAKKFELLADVDSNDLSAFKAQSQKLSFGDVVVFGTAHITTVLTPNLVWEKSDPGTFPFRIIDLEAVGKFWSSFFETPKRIKFYRPKKALQLERVLKSAALTNTQGPMPAQNVLFKKDSSGFAIPFLPSKATAKISGIKMFQTDDQTKLNSAPSCILNKDQTIGLNNVIKIKNNLSLLEIKVPSSGCPQFKGNVLVQAFDDLAFN